MKLRLATLSLAIIVSACGGGGGGGGGGTNITSGSGLLSQTPQLLPDLKAKYDKLCGPLTNMQNAIPVDINKDGRKDLVLNLWCRHYPDGEIYSGAVPNTLIVLIQNSDGSYTDKTQAVLGQEMPMTEGKGHAYVVFDFNKDGFDDVVITMDGEDGRAPSDQYASNMKFPTVALMSKGDGTMQITQFGPPVIGQNLKLIENPTGNSVLLVLPADGTPQLGWIYSDSWQIAPEYNFVPGTNVFDTFSNVAFNPRSNGISSVPDRAIVANKNNSVQDILLWTWNASQWSKLSQTNFLTYRNVTYTDSVGKNNYLTATNIFGRNYFDSFLYDGCNFKISTNSAEVPLFSMLALEVVGSYTLGQPTYSGSVQPTVDLVTFDANNDSSLSNIRSLAKVNLDSNYYRLVCADLNSDGKQDVMIRQLDRPIALINNVSGGLTKIKKSTFPDAPNGSTFVFEDLDGDGYRDLLYFPIDGWKFEGSGVYSSVRLKIYKGLRHIGSADAE